MPCYANLPIAPDMLSVTAAAHPDVAWAFGPALRRRSLKGAPDFSYDLPPTDEGKGETGAESDRHLGNPTVTHQSTLIRYPAGTMAPPRHKNVVGMN